MSSTTLGDLTKKSASPSPTSAQKRKPKKKYKAETVRLAFAPWFANGGVEDDAGEIRAFCPICEDPTTSNSPSASLNPEQGVWNCMKGNHGGSIHALAADLKAERGWDIRSAAMKGKHADPSYREETAQRLKNGPEGRPLPSRDEIAALTERLLASPEALAELTSRRGFTRETIIKWDLGYDGQRYTIPVRGADGEIVNVRRYKLDAKRAQDKMLNLPGHGSAAIFGLSILEKHDTVVITEGETDCILLNQFGIPAVTHTAGASTFRPQWGPLFTDKTVFVCYDVDDAGRKGAAKVQSILQTYAKAVFKLELPLTDKGADVTDYLHKEGYTSEDFLSLMDSASADSEAHVSRPVPVAGRKVSLLESMSEAVQNDVIEITVSVAGKQSEPFTAPKRIVATCDMSKGAACTMCPVMAQNGHREVELRPDDEELFKYIDRTDERRRALMKETVGARCSDRVEFEVPEDYHVEELLVQQSVDDRQDDESQTPQKRTVFSVGTHKTSVNQKYRVIGRNTTDPKNGKLKLMVWESESVGLDIDNFRLSAEDQEAIAAMFQPDLEQSPLDKCIEIAKDLSTNVTHIYGRDILHVAYDLVFHSVLSFDVFDLHIDKGWLEMMVVGDTRTGKSEIAKSLIGHYRSGELLSCEGMSFAGIVGGVQQIDGRWHMTWGAVPMNDRRMVILDEVSGMKEAGVIEQMSSIRSSGIAQITKIQSEQTSARTRLAWITNPADGSALVDNPDLGMAALSSVVPNAEDQARFDFVCAAMKGEVSNDIINSGFGEEHEPHYTAEMCEKLVKWAWSLGSKDVVISTLAAKEAVNAAKDLGSRYVSNPPLIQSENVRYKVLRIAAALAARTYSVDKRGRLSVKKEHVKDAVRFLDLVYGQESMGYARKSRRSILAEERARERKFACKQLLEGRQEDVLHTLRMVGGRTFRQRDFEQIGGLNSDEAITIVRQFLNWRMVEMRSRGDIAMRPQLIEIIREMEDEEDEI